jgi:hypothetical protein
MSDDRGTGRGTPSSSRASTGERSSSTEPTSAAERLLPPERPASADAGASAERRSGSAHSHRTERRSARRVARRRKNITRLSWVAGPVVILILVIVALFVFLGGPESAGGAETTSTTMAAVPADGSSVLFVEQEETAPAVVMLLPSGEGGLALAMPGNTLLKTGNGFRTLAELRASSEEQVLREALAQELGVNPGSIASVQWPDLQAALAQQGVGGSLPAELEATAGGAAKAAEAVVALVGASAAGGGSATWDQLEMTGDPEGFRAAVEQAAGSAAGAVWTEEVLPGKIVEGVGFEYFEPDLQQARALLGGEASGAAVTVEVQNGSGVVGVAQQAGGMLEPLGYELLPFRNAEDFPDVRTTRIISGPDASAAAEQVREVLGVGKIEEDGSLEPGRLIVVVGKDFIPPASSETDATG